MKHLLLCLGLAAVLAGCAHQPGKPYGQSFPINVIAQEFVK